MKIAAEYKLATALIEHLQGDGELSAAVLAEPFDHTDQCQAIALAAQQHDFAIAVEPLPVQLPTDPTDRTGVATLRLAVHVLTTTHVTPKLACDGGQLASGQSAAALAASVQGAVLAACCTFCPEGVRGIPYALPVLESVAELDLSKFDSLANLTGAAIILTHKANLKQYYLQK